MYDNVFVCASILFIKAKHLEQPSKFVYFAKEVERKEEEKNSVNRKRQWASKCTPIMLRS